MSLFETDTYTETYSDTYQQDYFENDYYDEELYEEELTEEELLLLELEREKAIKLEEAMRNMINKRFGGNSAGKNAIKTVRKQNNNLYLQEKTVLDEKNFNYMKNDVKVAGFRKQEEFGARKRIKP